MLKFLFAFDRFILYHSLTILFLQITQCLLIFRILLIFFYRSPIFIFIFLLFDFL